MRLLASFVVIAVCLAGQAPQVVTVSPAVGSEDVALDVGQILVVFDRPMGPAFDFIAVPGKEMPPLSGDPLFLSPQMCRIPLDPLKPGTTYGLSLSGFVAKDGTCLAPYVLSFKAAGVAQGGGAGDDPAHPAALCGKWSRQIPNLNLPAHYVLAADGAVTGGLGPEAQAVLPLKGTWSVEGSRLSVETDVGAFAGAYTLGNDGNLRVEGVGVLERSGSAPLPPAPPIPDSGKGGNSLKGGGLKGDPPPPVTREDSGLGYTDQIVGIWQWTAGGKKETVYFRRGGRYTEIKEEEKKKEIEDGKWELSEGFFDITTGVFAPKTVTCATPEFDQQGNMVWGEKTYRRLSGGSATPVALSAPALLGRWIDEDDSGRVEYVFNAQGRYSEELAMSSGECYSSYGPFELRDGAIVLTNEVNGKSKRSPAKLPNRDHLEFEMEPGKTFDVYRISSDPNIAVPGGGAPPPPPPPPPGGGVAGTWTASGGGVSAEIVFNTDGTYSRQWTEDGQTTASQGTWKQEESFLRIYDRLEGEERFRIAYKLLTPDSLEITVDGETLRLHRKGAKVVVPQELIGAWSARDQSGSIRLVLKPDATFIWDLSNTQQQWHFAGNFTHTPGQIHLVDTQTGGSYDLPYVFAQGLLTVTLDGNQIPMQKER